MAKLHFQATIEITGVNPYVLVSKEQAETLKAGWHKPMPVVGQINGEPQPPWRINMMPIGDGSFYLYLHGGVRKASHTKVGDSVTVDVDFDSDYKNEPMHDMPDDLQTAMEANPAIKTSWEALPPSRQKEVLRYLDNLKSSEARERNLLKTIAMLSGEVGHFIGRDWRDGK